MAGSREGGLKAAAKNKAKYGEDYYARIGSEAQKAYMSQPAEERKPRGFAAMPREKVSAAGKKGGRISRRATKLQA